MATKLEDQKTEAVARLKQAHKDVLAIERSDEYIALDRVFRDAEAASSKQLDLIDKTNEAHIRKLLKLPKRATWEQVQDALASLVGRWAGFTNDDIKAGTDQHQNRSLTDEASVHVRKTLFDTFPLPAEMNRELARLKKAEDAAKSKLYPLTGLLRLAQRELSRAQSSLREIDDKIRKRNWRKQDQAAATSTPEKTKSSVAHKESRKKLRELTGFGLSGWHKADKAKPHKEALKKWLKKELTQ